MKLKWGGLILIGVFNISDLSSAAIAASNPIDKPKNDIQYLISLNNGNSGRFMRDYVDKPISITGSFKAADHDHIEIVVGRYRARCMPPTWLDKRRARGSADETSPASSEEVADWNPGDRLVVKGRIWKIVDHNELWINDCGARKTP